MNIKKSTCRSYKTCIFMSIFMFYMLLFYVIVCYNKHWSGAYESTYNKIKNAESFYIAKSYTKANGKTSSVIVRKLGTLNQLIVEHE